MFFASAIGFESVVKNLVNHGADVYKENKYGETALFEACSRYSSYEEVVKYLVEHGAEIDKKKINVVKRP